MRFTTVFQMVFAGLISIIYQVVPFSAFAEEPVRLDEVVVTATRIEEPIKDVAQDITVITRKEIESGSYRDLAEIVRNTSGLHLTEYGDRGANALASLRGSTAEQVLVMVDGKRLNKPGDGLFDLNTLPVPIENIERVEIMRGASSALYGADAMGGVINIITKIPDRAAAKLTASYGRFATQDYSLTASQKIRDTGFFISLSKEKSDGFRTNSDYDIDAISTKITHNASQDIRVDLTFDYNHKDAGSPGALTWPTPLASETDENLLAGIIFKIKDTVLKLYSHNARIRYINPGSEDNTHKNHVNGIDLQQSLAMGSSSLLTGGIEILEEDLDSSDNINPSNSIGSHSRTRKGIFLQDEMSLSDKVITTLGLRYDSIADHARFSPKASILFKLPWDSTISLSAGQGFRVPEMNALFWPDTGWAVGNPNLKPEKSIEYESVVRKFFGNTGDVKIVAFEKRSDDLIQWQEVSPGKWSPVNISKARVRGFETEGKLHLALMDIGVNYTFTDPEDRTSDSKIRFGTRHQIKGSLSAYPMKGTTIALEGSYVSMYVVQKGDPGCYFLLDGKISREVKLAKGTAEVFIIGKNMLDRDFQTIKDYPMPPVRFFGGISYRF
ncbi:MAG: TonB-dependent receptor [Thermodesulfovibrionales bacterium]|jgi:outer membrane cobalamin receptor